MSEWTGLIRLIVMIECAEITIVELDGVLVEVNELDDLSVCVFFDCVSVGY